MRVPRPRFASTAEWFESRYIPEPNSGCWLWLFAINAKGYGHFERINTKERSAHRFSYSFFVGEIPRGQQVLHRCDVRCCVNPEHLFLGTHADNMADMAQKGRAHDQLGSRNGNAKLTEAQVLAIREDKRALREIAEEYGMSIAPIHKAKTGYSWRHLK